MRTLATISMLAVAAVLAACAGPTQTVDATQPTVSYQYRAVDGKSVTAQAANYCAQRYNARAEAISRTLNGDIYTATFRCIP